MQLTENKITTIIYEKDTGETTSRTIIPVQVPKDLIRAIDLSETDNDVRAEIAQMYDQYVEYRNTFMKNMLTFEKWIDHTHNKEVELKWRSFKTSGLR